MVSERDAGISPAVVGIEHHRAFEQFSCAAIAGLRELVQTGHALEDVVPGTEILRLGHDQAFVLGALQFGCDDGGDALGEFVLQREDVLHVAVVTLGPDVVAALGVDQLGGHPHPLAGPAYAAFQHITRAELFDPATEAHRGRIVKTTGDGVLVEFASAVDAVEHAVEVQQSLARREAEVADDRRISLRIGINLGDVIVDGDDIYGDGVNIAARLEALAEPGGICLSGDVYRQVRGKLDAVFVDLGEQSVKNIAEPVRIYGIDLAAAEATPGAAMRRADSVLERHAVAVLPFAHFGGDPEQEYFADGLTEDIITALSVWRSFPVIARNSSFAYKGQTPDVREFGEKLGARYVLEGSVRRAGGRVRVTAQLIDAETGHHVWAERYDRNLEDIFAVQDELTQGIAAVVAPELERAEHKRLIVTKPQDLGAWDHVLQGMACLAEFSEASNRRARERFERAAALDPEYSRAYAGLAHTYHREILLGFGPSRDEALAKLQDNARRAVQLDGADFYGHWELAIGYLSAGEYDLGLAEALRALELNPSNAHGYNIVGAAYVLLGQADQAIENHEMAMRLNPHDPRLNIALPWMGRAHFTARRYDQAREWLRKSVKLNPDIPETHVVLAATLGHLGEIEQARASLEACERLRPSYLETETIWIWYKDEADNEHFRDGLRKAGWEG